MKETGPLYERIWGNRLWGRLLFSPTRHPIACDKRRLDVVVGKTFVELWVDATPSATPELVVLRLLGARGRGELATRDPARFMPEVASVVATVNPPGFGGSPGPCAPLQYFAAIEAAFDTLVAQYPNAKIWVHGKSIGGLGALYLAAVRNPAAIVVKNVVNPQGIAWRYLGVFGRAVPSTLDGYLLATSGRCPALFVISRDDRLARPALQRHVISVYGGDADSLEVGGAHDERALATMDEGRYSAAVRKLWQTQ